MMRLIRLCWTIALNYFLKISVVLSKGFYLRHINKFCITHAYKVLQFKKYKSNEYSHSFEEKTVYVP